MKWRMSNVAWTACVNQPENFCSFDLRLGDEIFSVFLFLHRIFAVKLKHRNSVEEQR